MGASLNRMADDDYTILVPLGSEPADARALLEVAAALVPVEAGQARGRVVALGIVAVPADLAVSEGALPAHLASQRLGRLSHLQVSPPLEVRPLVSVSARVWEGL